MANPPRGGDAKSWISRRPPDCRRFFVLGSLFDKGGDSRKNISAVKFQIQPKEFDMRKIVVSILLVVVLALSTVGIAGAVTDGQPDGNGHPYFVLLLMEVNGQPAFRCSATLISPTYVLTAGHCAGAPGEFSGMRVFTESNVQTGNNNYPFAGPNSVEAVRWAAHPLYPSAPFYVHDVGMVELAEPINLAEYGQLPAVDSLDTLKTQRGKQDTTFTAVGYGLQQSFPDAASWKEHNVKVRMVATPRLIQINGGIVGDYSLLLSNNANTGGTCFGDSGGPNFIGNTNIIAGVTSFGMNGNCAGTGGVFRVDRKDVQDFIHDFMNP
jgi:secreted trypsin-like serine protease